MPIFFNILLIAISLSMDTFSLSLSYGLLNFNKSIIYKITFSVGLFHFIMPLIGNKFGDLIYRFIDINENLIIGIIFLLISIEMLNSLRNKEAVKEINNNLQIILFSLAVSIDSFSIGIAIDAIKGNNLLIVTIFMLVSSMFTYLGLQFGKFVNSLFGRNVEIIGIVMLFILSLTYFLKAF